MNKHWRIIILACIFWLSNCSTNKSTLDNVKLSDKELYENANSCFKKNKFDKAIEFYAKLNQEYPYSELAINSQVLEAYNYYLKKDYDMAVFIADDFIKIHPNNQYTPYVYYLKALSYYDQIQDIHHDQKTTEDSKEAAESLIAHFPDSSYARDFKIKLNLINEYLAGKEMMLGRFYLSKGQILAALNRFSMVVDKYQTTIHVEEALYRLVECYLKFGIRSEAEKNAAILSHNYPKSKWYKYAYELINRNSKNVTEPSN